MPSMVLREPAHIDALSRRLLARRLPLTVTWEQGASRSALQNRLSHRWYADISRQTGDRTTDEARAECKLVFGVPILRAENEAFRLTYDRVFRALPHDQKMDAIRVFDLPVTRLMTVKQMTAFMDALQRHWAAQGVRLTDPDAMRYEEEFA